MKRLIAGLALAFGAACSFATTMVPSQLVGFTQSGTGAVSRTLDARNKDYINAADFGVKCDNSTDNTTAFNNAVAAAQAANRPLYIFSNGGICKTNKITYNWNSNSISIYGDGAVLQKITADTDPVMVIGDHSMTHYLGPMTISGLVFSGASSTTSTAALLIYDVVRSNFTNNTFKNASNGVLAWGEISNYWTGNVFQNNGIGYRADADVTLYGGGVPNLITMVGNRYVDNSSYGIFFNGGNELFVKGFDIEGNGTTGTTASGGAYIAAATPGLGAVFESGWFENNAGGQNIWLNAGSNRLNSAMFIASPNAVQDIKVTAGNYMLDGVICVNSKSPNLSESGTTAGNMILNTSCANMSYVAANTSVLGGVGANSIGSLSASGTITPSTTAGIVGTTLADSAQAGSVGEIKSASVAFGSAVSLTSSTTAAITSLPLTAGDWDVWGSVCTVPAATTVQSYTQGAVSSTSASFTGAVGQFILPFTASAGNIVCASIPAAQVNVSSTTTYYLNINSIFTTSTNKGYGTITARRRR